jgi:uncharacterized protein YndB with AHSA1/START domain
MLQPEKLCLLIPDISGYTAYLAGVEIDHAQDIMADLIGTVVTSLRPAFRLVELEGDAAFTVAPVEGLDATKLLDTVERCYFSFRRRRRDVRAATSCECRACSRIPDLNLKFVAHAGPVMRQKMAGRESLFGADVIAVHRLLKNEVVAQLGLTAYALFSDALAQAVALDAPGLGMVAHSETYEHIGEIKTWAHDLERRWQEEEQRQRVYVGPQDAVFTMDLQIDAPPQVVWDFLTTPGRRLGWQGLTGTTDIEERSKNGRRGAGTVNHCAHGEAMVIEEIADYRPNDYLTLRSANPGLPFKMVMTFELEPTTTGTHMIFRIERPRKAEHVAIFEQFGAHMGEALTASYALMGEQAGAEAKELVAGRLEPPLPQTRNADNFLGELPPMEYVG